MTGGRNAATASHRQRAINESILLRTGGGRKRLGLANVQNIRHDRFSLLTATHRHHRFHGEEVAQIRDARRVPICLAGYSVSHRNGRPCVLAEANEYRLLKAEMLDRARHSSAEYLAGRFSLLPFVPYKPVRR